MKKIEAISTTGIHAAILCRIRKAYETILQFVIRFQNLWKQLARPTPDKDLKETFLIALREPLRTTLVVFDFKADTIEAGH